MKKADDKLIAWTKTQLKITGDQLNIVALAGDASARRYYRVLRGQAPSLILMDARQQQQECSPFLYLGECLQRAGLVTPDVHAYDIDQGLMLLTDFGDALLISRLQSAEHQAAALYDQAFINIAKIQSIPTASLTGMSLFDAAFMLREMNLFQEWFLSAYRGVTLSAEQEQQLNELLIVISQYLVGLPQCLMHRDFHSRNIMCLEDGRLGIIDYQGAVIGPLVYDLVSLLKDCYVSWPREQVEGWVTHFYMQHLEPSQRQLMSAEQFLYAFDVAGLQRHLKCAGLFARLALRDQKNLYLSELPRVLDYIRHMGELYSEFRFFSDLLQELEQSSATVAEEDLL
ncbi:aminoglycoside phosphotransferase family protein [Piscirickettsia salmonis]|uniref:aminoglycoside phosphotransferase family protein n=1 Tax=Piscirickettsia salmonis TaxID=1238 RepID=UPI000F0944CA|nr:phosphotransferase [Piscirickettsiaceae bacterium NZ-RLO2]